MKQNIQALGEQFNLETFLKARNSSIEAVRTCASKMEPGMSESDGVAIVEGILNDMGMERLWHPTKFRIGKNTLKSFKEKSDESVLLKENDIFFIDIGPVFENHEGDFGQTFTIGNDSEMIDTQGAAREIFWQTQLAWRESGISGEELYEEAKNITRQRGMLLNLNMSGHRLGDFPHALHYKGKLAEFKDIPLENIWVLEILIRHPKKDFGAFYEDILR